MNNKKIHILPPQIISKIAAGEVIERPSSCVKELVENSIDAEACLIEIDIENSGKSMIKIRDNGTGINRDDIDHVFLRHSTSKLTDIDDLYSIMTLGFRGEALHSIAAISDVILRTRSRDDEHGWEIHMRGGIKKHLTPVSMNTGTEITVRELFFNTPARKKFLKTDLTEFTNIYNIISPYLIMRNNVSFVLRHNKKIVFDHKADNERRKRVSKVLNLNENNILYAHSEIPDNGPAADIYMGDINIQRNKRDFQFFYVNGRPVNNKVLSFHMNQVYKLIFSQGVFPFFAVFLSIDPGQIDVNVHPAKREIKIRDDASIIRMIRHACEHTLMSEGKPRQFIESQADENSNINTKPSRENIHAEKKEMYKKPGEKKYQLFTDKIGRHTEKDISFEFSGSSVPLTRKLEDSRYIGSFINKYLIFENASSILFMDQHAAQERINYERLIKQIKDGKIETQNLLTPIVINLSDPEMLYWNQYKNKLESLGFSTTSWGNNCIAVHAYPYLISNPETSIRNILSGYDTTQWDDDKIARIACRQSVMTGDKLSSESAEYIRKSLLKCRDPFTCPHGRPTIIEIEEKFLHKQFLR